MTEGLSNERTEALSVSVYLHSSWEVEGSGGKAVAATAGGASARVQAPAGCVRADIRTAAPRWRPSRGRRGWAASLPARTRTSAAA